MKKIIYIILLLTGLSGFVKAQYSDQDNRFNQEQSQQDPAQKPASEENTYNGGVHGKPGNPGEVPINDYIPFLMLVGAGLIVFSHMKKKKSIN